jgi:hypothetical protein
MTDLERKLAEALRGQAGEVTPNLDAAWAEHQRRLRRPRRRRTTVVVAPLAAVLVVLTSVLLAVQLHTAPPSRPANTGEPLSLAGPEYQARVQLDRRGPAVAVADFVGQTDSWTAYALAGTIVDSARKMLCFLAAPRGMKLGDASSAFGIKSPCVPLLKTVVRAGYVGEADSPLPPGKAVYLVDPAVRELRLFDAAGDLSQAKAAGTLGADRVFVADVKPGSPPVRFEVS